VPSVDATLIAHNHICGFTQQIGDFSFSFIAPLGTDYYYVSQGYLLRGYGFSTNYHC
jgi:hypothetical protein